MFVTIIFGIFEEIILREVSDRNKNPKIFKDSEILRDLKYYEVFGIFKDF